MSATSDAGAPRKRPAASRAAARQTVTRAVQVLDGVQIEPEPVSVDRVPHGPRVRSEQEGREVDSVGIERKLRPHRAPVTEIGSRFRELGSTECKCPNSEPSPREQDSPSELRHCERLARNHDERSAPFHSADT